MIKLIIFDLDGLLVDSQPLQYKTYNQVFSQYGHPLSRDDWEIWIQKSHSARSWIEDHGLSLDPEKIRAEKKEIFDRLIEEELELKEGAQELVELLSKNYPLGLASASRMESIESCLNKFNLTDKFQIIESDVGTDRPKPYPDIYLTVAEKMQQEPPQCLVIEDSLAGLKAAKSAGMKCVICPDTFCNTLVADIEEADLIVKVLDEITLKMIEAL